MNSTLAVLYRVAKDLTRVDEARQLCLALRLPSLLGCLSHRRVQLLGVMRSIERVREICPFCEHF